jgi:putative oxidoreductase
MSSAAVAKDAPFGKPSKGLNIGLWVAQVLLAMMFCAVGYMKAFMPLDQIAKTFVWVPAVPAGLVRFIGFAELAGALGLILPSATRIQPKLTPLAALGLATVVLLGAGLHFSRGEGALTPTNFVLAALGIFVAWGRFKKVPIPPRS